MNRSHLRSAESVLSRIAKAADVSKDAEIAKALGVSRSTVATWRARGTVPYEATVEFAERKGLSLDWLLTGVGPMRREPSKGSMISGTVARDMTAGHGVLDRKGALDAYALSGGDYREWLPKVIKADLEAGDAAAVPFLAAEAGAGGGRYAGYADEFRCYAAFPAHWLREELHLQPDRVAMLTIHGDSMEPSLRSGDVVMVEQLDGRPRREGICVVRMGDLLMVKRLAVLSPGRIRLISDNPAYPPIEVDMDEGSDVTIIGRVVCAIRRV